MTEKKPPNSRFTCVACMRYCMESRPTAKTPLLSVETKSGTLCSDCNTKLGGGPLCLCGVAIAWVDARSPIHKPECAIVLKWCERCGERGTRPGFGQCQTCNSLAFMQIKAENQADQATVSHRPRGGAGSGNPRYGGDPNAAPWAGR
jgi:hypothetical protein